MKTIYFAGGCFWGVEKYLLFIPGVVRTEVGYANGRTENPSYEDVCRRNTGHAETVKVDYDPSRLDLSFLLELFFEIIDPTSLNRQGNDVGEQYRTGVYYIDDSDKAVIEAAVSVVATKAEAPVVVEVKPLENYYPAEEYHQKYLDKNPKGYCHVGPSKFEQLQKALEKHNVGS